MAFMVPYGVWISTIWLLLAQEESTKRAAMVREAKRQRV